MKKLIIAFATLALATASAASNTFRFTVSDPAWVGGTQLKPGDYKIEMEGNKAVIKSGKNSIEVPVTVETAKRKYETNELIIQTVNSKPSVMEIHRGGSNERIVFQKAPSPTE